MKPKPSTTTTPDTSLVIPLAVGRREAARALGISERLLWSWTNQGRIPHVRIGHRVLYPRADLERWLSEQSAKGGRR